MDKNKVQDAIAYDFNWTENEFRIIKEQWSEIKKRIDENYTNDFENKELMDRDIKATLGTCQNVEVNHYEHDDLKTPLGDGLESKVRSSSYYYENGFQKIEKLVKEIENFCSNPNYNFHNDKLYQNISDIIDICNNCMFYDEKSFWILP